MHLMDWNDSLDVGVEDMNNQHKQILLYMNSLYKSFKADEDFSIGKPILDKLKNTTISHFANEEAYMKSISFSNLESHKLIHKNLLATFTEHYDKMTKEQKFNQEFFEFLKFWLTSHIKGIDIKYSKDTV